MRENANSQPFVVVLADDDDNDLDDDIDHDHSQRYNNDDYESKIKQPAACNRISFFSSPKPQSFPAWHVVLE